MAVPACPDCGASIEPDWDWCHRCGFDPEGLKPAGWSPTPPAAAPESTAPAPPPSAPTRADRPPASLRPSDLLRPRPPEAAAPAAGAGPVTGPLPMPDDDEDHQPLSLEDVLKSARRAPVDAGEDGTAPGGAEPPRDRFAVAAERARPPRPSDLAGPADPRPPLFPEPDPGPSRVAAAPAPTPEGPPAPVRPAPVPAPAAVATPTRPAPPDEPTRPAPPDEPARAAAPPADRAAPPEPLDPPAAGDDPGSAGGEPHPYLDLPYAAPTPPPGPEAEEPASGRRRRRRSAEPLANAASMAMAAGRGPTEGEVAEGGLDDRPPPPPPRPAPAADEVAAPDESRRPVPEPVERASSPADSSSLGPIVFGAPAMAPVPAPPRSERSSPLSVAAILMTIAISVIVLWGVWRNLESQSTTPALPPPSAGPIGYAPAGPDGSRAAVDPKRTASWSTSSPEGSGFEVDMPGVVVVRTPTVSVGSGATASAVVASSTNGRGGYVVAAVRPPEGTTWTSLDQATTALLDGFDDTTGNDLTAGAPTTVGGLPATSVEGTVDSVPSKGAVVLSGTTAYLVLAGNVSDSNLDRFLTSFSTTG